MKKLELVILKTKIMKRISLTDGSGSWFDADKADCYNENTYWNGSNHISKATGSQWHHETIYVTTSGNYVLQTWSNYQGVDTTYSSITLEEASVWFLKQGFTDEEMPDEISRRSNVYEI